MPGQNGIEFLEAVREDHPDLAFILFTGKGSEELASEAISAGVSDYLQKSGGTDQFAVLANRITNLVTQQRAEARVERYTRRRRESERYHQRLLEITSEPEMTPGEKTRQLLELGVERLGVDNGHLVEIDEESGRHRIVSVCGSEIVQEGLTDLSETYCRRTIESDEILDVHDAPEQGWNEDPAYKRYDIGCYVGKKLLLDGDLYGTVCFVSEEPRAEPLSQEETIFVDLLSRSLNQLLERQQWQSQLETVFQHTQDALFLVDVTPDRQFRIRRVNRAYEDRTGLDADDLRGKSPRDVVGEEEGAKIERRYRKCIERNEPIEYEEALPIDGRTVHFRTKLAPVSEGQEVVQLVGATRDITDQKERQRTLERYRQMMDTLPDPACLIDEEGRYDIVNPALAELHGKSSDALRGDQSPLVRQVRIDHDGDDPYEELVDGRRDELSGEQAITLPNGESRTFEYRLRRITDDGSFDGIIAAGRDISERKERERELREERRFVEQALNTLNDVFYVVDPSGELRRWNDQLSTVTGYSDEEIADMEAVDFFPADERERIAAAIEETLTTGETTVEAEFLTADGVRVPYEFTGARLTDLDDDLTGLVGVGRDITDRKRRVEVLSALHETTQTFMDASDPQAVVDHAVETARTVLEQPVNTIWLYDEDDDVLEPAAWTDEAVDVVGEMPIYAGGDSLSWRAFERGEVRVYNDLTTEDTYNADTPIRSEIVLPLGDYGVMNIGSTDSQAIDDIDVSLARILADIVETALGRADRERALRTQRLALQRENERLEEFVGVVSHDLRNPLNVAQGRLELAREECESEDLDAVADALDRSQALIDDLMTLAREGDTVDEAAPVHLARLAEDCWRTVQTADASLVVESDQTIRSDRSRLQQLLENLVRNAVEHGGEDVTVTIGEMPDGFYVADDGPGIPEEERDDIFESGYSTASEGTGFGLSIVKQIVEAHGWRIVVTESGEGGARFEITGVEFDPE